ncbi:MAG: hypothetical protein B6I31_00830 [Desulfobacteraceae bacterium 4572_19]|nr:MAG: hypothetical protein B6I31_00830 [Desulfobacteraceae bacterium 4572_19]
MSVELDSNGNGGIDIEKGGTNATTVSGAKTNLGLDNVDNTADADKPVSTAMQTALDLKANQANVLALNNTTEFTPDADYEPATKKYVDDNGGGGGSSDNIITDTTTSRTLAVTDNDKFIRFTEDEDVTIIFPPNSSIAFPIGGGGKLFQEGEGKLSVEAGSGVTIHSFNSILESGGKYSLLAFKKLALDVWGLTGGLMGTLGDSSPKVAATGGAITTAGEYKIHTFTSSGIFTVTAPGYIEYLIVGGGGGGGYVSNVGGGGGGGAGGFLTNGLMDFPVSLSTPNYSVVVGAGGASFTNGENSSFGTELIAIGGGRGGSPTPGSATSGGSGGGGWGRLLPSGVGESGTSGQGNSGGNGIGHNATERYQNGGGGGGAGGAGLIGVLAGGGAGGPGIVSAISGSSRTYAGGGGGGNRTSGVGGAGGAGGGGAGGSNSDGIAGLENTGGGGGGAGQQNSPHVGGAGGSGIVIIRYQYR